MSTPDLDRRRVEHIELLEKDGFRDWLVFEGFYDAAFEFAIDGRSGNLVMKADWLPSNPESRDEIEPYYRVLAPFVDLHGLDSIELKMPSGVVVTANRRELQ